MQEPTYSQSIVFRGINSDTKIDKLEQGQIYYALNAVVSSFDGNFPAYQNENGNVLCTDIPTGYQVIGSHVIPEDNLTVLWMVNKTNSRIGILNNDTCSLTALVSSPCFKFDTAHPILKAVHRKTECSTEVYWVDGKNKPSFINLNEVPFQTVGEGCDQVQTTVIDCNKTRLQPSFSLPQIEVEQIRDDGDMKAGSYQFAISMANSLGEDLTSAFSVTNIVPIYNKNITTENYDYQVSKSIELKISNLDTTGVYEYFNLKVIQTVNNITTVYLVGTYDITGSAREILYTGANKQQIQGDILDIFVKYPVYQSASDITSAQDVLILGGIEEQKRVSYQSIANQIHIKWATIEKTLGDYADPLIVNKYTGYLRGEVYSFELVPLKEGGIQGDSFPIPGREATPEDLELVNPTSDTPGYTEPHPKWKSYDTSSVDGEPASVEAYQTGEMAYYESTELYPCDEAYGRLANTPIRLHKFPDNSVSPFTDGTKMYPIGIYIDPQEVQRLINDSNLPQEEKDQIIGYKIVRADRRGNKSIVAKGIVTHVMKYTDQNGTELYAPNYLYDDISSTDPYFKDIEVDPTERRFTFHGPNTSFAQPSLPSIMKIDGFFAGTAKMHFREVANHAKYTLEVRAPIGGVNFKIDANPAKSLNSVGTYDVFEANEIPGVVQRHITSAQYISPGMIGGDDLTINNFQRESSVYIKVDNSFGLLSNSDNSKQLPSCDETAGDWERKINAWYTSLKNNIPNQYGSINSYDIIDTGYQYIFDSDTNPGDLIFGGDTFINRFAYKSKLPIFVDNMIGKPNNSDVLYSKKGNLGDPKYYLDAVGYDINDKEFAYEDRKLICQVDQVDLQRLDYYGILPIFLYGIPYFPVESEVNVDMRKATNSKEGDYYPHVTSAIPDNWLAEETVSIQQDNTYNYNVSYSKQNKENSFTHIPTGYDFNECNYLFPFRCVFSEPQQNVSNPLARNNWRIFRPSSYFDFPQNYGKLISLDGVENKQVYARFENKTLLYNALLTAPTTAEAVYLGQSLFKSDVPPLDFADTDLGYAGTQNKFFLKTEYGNISTDAKRGSIVLYQGRSIKDLGKQGISKFLKKYLKFFIKDSYPEIDIDNNYLNIGITGVYDSLYNRLLITKLDYEPKVEGIRYSNGVFTHLGKEISLSDTNYFRNMSFTLSYSFDINGWTSFHSYLPNYYIGENAGFKTGIHNSIWTHNKDNRIFNNFYGNIEPYVLEIPVAYQRNDEILQSITDYSKVDIIVDQDNNYVQDDSGYFNKLIISNDQQTSGVLNLFPKPLRNMAATMRFPKYNTDSKDIIYTKRDNVYRINTFWSVTTNPKQALWLPSDKSLSEFKILNQENCSYKKTSHNKAPFRAKDLKLRFILDNRSDIRITQEYNIQESQQSII